MAPVQATKHGATILDFGRFSGQSLRDIARSDPDYLDWLVRTPIGWPMRTEIKAVMEAARTFNPRTIFTVSTTRS
jgi:hypothetical protein